MRLATVALALLAVALPASAQGRWLDTFAVPGASGGPTRYGTVYTVIPDGAGALIGGDFRTIDGVEASSVARWTGAAWEAFGGGVRQSDGTPGIVRAVLRDASGAVWVTGAFAYVVQANGALLSAGGLARWVGGQWTAPAGLVGLDSPGAGYALVEDRGAVYVGGQFSGVDPAGGTRVGSGGVIRWTEGQFYDVRPSPFAYALAPAPGGGVLFASFALQPNGSHAPVIVRYDGQSAQPYTSPLAPNQIYDVFALSVSGGRLAVGGNFAGGIRPDGAFVPSVNVIEWDGQTWQAVGRGARGTVWSLARDAKGRLFVGGDLLQGINPNGTAVPGRGLPRWDGAAWTALPVEGFVYGLARIGADVAAAGQLSPSEAFLSQQTGDATVRAGSLLTLTPADAIRPLSAWTGRDGIFGSVSDVAEGPCGRIWATGSPSIVGGPNPAFGPLGEAVAAAWNGTAWTPLPNGLRGRPLTASEVTAYTTSISPTPGTCGGFVLGGVFGGTTGAGGTVASRNVVRWDGQAWRPLGHGTDRTVRAVAHGSDGAVYVAGEFVRANQASGVGVVLNGVGRWTAAGGWMPLGRGLTLNGFPGVSYALLPEPDGSVVVAGAFDHVVEADGTARPALGIARWTGTAWDTFGGIEAPSESSRYVSAVTRWRGMLVAGGRFERVVAPSGAATAAVNVAAWDGAAWRALPATFVGSEGVRDLAVSGDDLYGVGAFQDGAARWDGAAWQPFGGGGTRHGGRAAALAADRATGRLYVAGSFLSAGPYLSPGLAAYDSGRPVMADPGVDTRSDELQSFPNPSRTSATLAFRLDAAGPARLTLVDALGRTVAVLHDGALAAGEQTVRLDTARLPAGVYVARLDAGGRVETRRITVVR